MKENEVNPKQVAWREWNQKNIPPVFTAEQTIEWLEQMRAWSQEIRKASCSKNQNRPDCKILSDDE